MTEFDPSLNEEFRECADLQLRRHYLLSDHEDESEEIVEVEERLEELWPRLDDIQRRSLSGMGSDLNWIRRDCEPPPKGRKSPNDVSAAERNELEGSMRSKEWHRVLHFLRLCAPVFEAASLASERRIAYEAIGFPKYANAFAQLVGQGFKTFIKKYRVEGGQRYLYLEEVKNPVARPNPIGPAGRRSVVANHPVQAGIAVRA